MPGLKEKYGEYALITGASSGIGKAFAEHLANAGCNLVLSARRAEILEQLKDEYIKSYGISVKVVPADLTKEEDVDKLISETSGIEVGMLINNAGFGQVGRFENLDRERGLKMIQLNCTAPFLLTSHFLKQMIERRRGAVIIVGSIVGALATPYYTTYSATKGFDNLLGEGLWQEMREHGIDVLAVAPGGTRTEFQEHAGSRQKPFYREANDVVRTTFAALGKKPRAVDGFLNKVMLFAHRFVPRSLAAAMAGKVVMKNEGVE